MDLDQSFDVNVKDFQGGSVVIKVYPDWDVSRVKNEIAMRTNVSPDDFRVVFAGQTLMDNDTLWVRNACIPLLREGSLILVLSDARLCVLQ